jgi:HlyD family secretion protein
VPVKEHQVQRGPIVAEVLGTGTLEARVKTTISTKISGRINLVHVDQGDRVRAGQSLFTLDDADLKQQVRIAEAGLAAAQAALGRFQADRNSAVAVLKQVRREHARSHKLAVNNVIAEADIDRVDESLSVAESGLARAEAAAIEGQRQVAAAQETLEFHRARLTDTVVSAPYDGLIVHRHRDPGDVIVPGSPVLSLINTEVLWVNAWVDETEMARIHVGQPARVVFRSDRSRSYIGRVARLGRETDRETREYIVDVTVLEYPGNWAVGQRAEVYIQTASKPSAVLLPAAYVVWRGGNPGTLLNADGWSAWRGLSLGVRTQEMVEIVEGLQGGETAIVCREPGAVLKESRRVTFP